MDFLGTPERVYVMLYQSISNVRRLEIRCEDLGDF
jgi:hypothetical protein